MTSGAREAEAGSEAPLGLFDPRRPKIGGHPAYRRLMAVLPPITLRMAEGLGEDGSLRFQVRCWIARGHNRFAEQTREMNILHFQALMWDYRNDPEGALERWFGFREAEAERNVHLSLEEAKAEARGGREGARSPPPLPAASTSSPEDLGF